jgi:hypothetical protein
MSIDIQHCLNDLRESLQFITRIQFVLSGFMSTLASHLERSRLIHSRRRESAGDRSTWLLVTSVRLAPAGLARKIVPEDFFASLPVNSTSYVQYAC